LPFDVLDKEKVMKNYRRHFVIRKLIAACLAALMCGTAAANPTGPTVVNGLVTFSVNGTTLTVTNSPNSIINWQGFSISAAELTQFVQQSASSAVLNRVVSANPSTISGALQSNGRVFLVNPNGIVFGVGSQVDVGGLVASTLNITDANFVAGTHTYTAGAQAGPISVIGSIAAQKGVYLIAPNITISGPIASAQGTFVAAAGQSVNIVESSAGNAISATSAGSGLETITVNNGIIISAQNFIFESSGSSNSNIGTIVTNNNPIPLSSILSVSQGQLTNLGSLSTGSISLGTGSSVATGFQNISAGGAVTLSTGSVSLGRGSSVATGFAGNFGAGGAITVSGTAAGAHAPQFVFSDPSTIKVVAMRDATGSVTGWSLAPQ
jgi:filamentous hemagglutinin family protein